MSFAQHLTKSGDIFGWHKHQLFGNFDAGLSLA